MRANDVDRPRGGLQQAKEGQRERRNSAESGTNRD